MVEDLLPIEPPAAALALLPEGLRPGAADMLATFGGILQAEDNAQVRAEVSEHLRDLLQLPLQAAGYDEREALALAFQMVELVVAHSDELAGRAAGAGLKPH